MTNYLRMLRAKEAEPTDGEAMSFVASTPGVKRDGLKIDQLRWRLEDYRANPVVLWAHDYNAMPIGNADVEVVDGQLMARVTWDMADETAQKVRGKYERGFLNAVSVGWRDIDEGEDGVYHELLDVSAVPVPGDPQALAERTRAALRDILTEMEPDEGTWEEAAAEMVSALTPHPDEAETERRRRYDALLPAYRRAGKVPPEWMGDAALYALSGDLWRGLFLEGEVPDHTRVGAVLNGRNRERLGRIKELGGELSSLAQEVLDSAEKETPDEPPKATDEKPADDRSTITARLRDILEVLS